MESKKLEVEIMEKIEQLKVSSLTSDLTEDDLHTLLLSSLLEEESE